MDLISVVDPFHVDPDPQIRFMINQSTKSEKNYIYFFLIFSNQFNAQKCYFLLLFMSLFNSCILNKKLPFFKKKIGDSCNFWWILCEFSSISCYTDPYPDPFHEADPDSDPPDDTDLSGSGAGPTKMILFISIPLLYPSISLSIHIMLLNPVWSLSPSSRLVLITEVWE